MQEVLMEGAVTAIATEDEFVIGHGDDTPVSSLMEAYRLAATRGFTVLSDQYYDTNGDLNMIVITKDVSA